MYKVTDAKETKQNYYMFHLFIHIKRVLI